MPSSNKVWLVGGGGHAKVVIAAFQACEWEVAGIFDADPEVWGRRLLDVEILGDLPQSDWWKSAKRSGFLSIGANASRARLATLLTSANWATAVHPSATVHASACLGPGVLVGAHAVVQPDARIGAHAIINTAAVVEHDCHVGDFGHIGPRACLAGAVRVGEGAFVGAGATVTPSVRIGAWSTIGAGAAVIQDVPAGVTAVGVPAQSRHCPSGPRSAAGRYHDQQKEGA